MQRVVEAGAVDSPLFESKGDLIAERDFEPRFPVDLQVKDLRDANEVKNDGGMTLRQTAAARESFSAASAMGHGEADMTAVLNYLEEVAGVTVSSSLHRSRRSASKNRDAEVAGSIRRRLSSRPRVS